jgi:hypothetical protein
MVQWHGVGLKVVSVNPGKDCSLWSLGKSIHPTFRTPPRCEWILGETEEEPATE